MQGQQSGLTYAHSSFWWQHPQKFSALLQGYRGVLGKKEQLKQPFLSAPHAQGVHWLKIWDISQNKQERDVLTVFVSMTR